MSRHEGVSCDSCLKSNFRGRRYKCLVCYDYDLCATCYESGGTSTRHTTDHPVQCILTRTDFDVFYGGEPVSVEQPQSFTCPFCGKMGFNETTLQEHASAEHRDSAVEVVCPVCAALPGGDPNHMTDDFAAHLTLQHRQSRDFISFQQPDLVHARAAPPAGVGGVGRARAPATQTSAHSVANNEPLSGMRHVRRIPPSSRGGVGGANRVRARNIHLQGSASGAPLGALSPQSRDSMDPITELLSQLSSVRQRAAAAQNVSSQLQQLEMQLQQSGGYREQQTARLQRRPAVDKSNAPSTANGLAIPAPASLLDFASLSQSTPAASSAESQFLLPRVMEAEVVEGDQQQQESELDDRSLFVQELLLSTLTSDLRLDDDDLVPQPRDLERRQVAPAEQPQPAEPRVVSSRQTAPVEPGGARPAAAEGAVVNMADSAAERMRSEAPEAPAPVPDFARVSPVPSRLPKVPLGAKGPKEAAASAQTAQAHKH